ncbi:Ig-like domain-containing protein [Pontibacter anaerobius]|uniref:Ig-like domain-containing protein n=1 Tax=Pontibacter anaerobius TaxID=2993940 RepID=A0ABT3RDN9_9BACT|nr:Ig-like domain-containing protein [Pontibacter anaerobius]MCX2739650.1 Ig-like domain-containing protein [Pontibacter anaerobius]
MTEAEMEEVWKLMSEDFRPFDLNVTTSEAVFNNAPADRRMRVIFTPTNYFAPGYGGYAYIGSFTFGSTSYGETPCWVWNAGVIGAGEAGSHEVGHTLGLVHDGRGAPYSEEYYSGHDSWAPIMGTGYYRSVVQWSKGEYAYANNTEDDLQTITTRNGFGYRADDHGNTAASATSMVIEDGGEVLASVNKGVISSRTDVDMFSFTTSGGEIAFDVNPDPSYPNLDLMLTVRDIFGELVATADPSTLAASLHVVLEAGTYYLEIDGVAGSMGANSDFASLGEYFIAGNIPVNFNQSPLVSLVTPVEGQEFTANQKPIRITATAFDSDGTVSKVEFYSGDVKLGEDLKAPYSYHWKRAAVGNYVITAHATDNMGAVTVSEPVSIKVVAPGIKKNQIASSKILATEMPAGVEVYPNPITTDNYVKIALPAHFRVVSLIIYELGTGKRLSERNYKDASSLQVEVSALPRGLYGLTIKAEGQVWTKKLAVIK